MTSGSTREFMAMCAIAQHLADPAPDRSGVDRELQRYLKGEYPHLLAIQNPATRAPNSASP